MAIKSLIGLNLKLHKMMHPFDHFVHGGLVILIVWLVKLALSFFFAIAWHVNVTLLFICFVITTVTSVFAEAKILKNRTKSKLGKA